MTSTIGFVYCLTIPRMDGVVKIGYTLKTMEERLKSLDNTSVVEPFQLYYAGRVNNPKRVEGLIHEYFKMYRIRPNREFFEVDPLDVKRIIQIAEASTDIAPTASDPVESAPDIEYAVTEIIDPEEVPSDEEKTQTRKESSSRREKKEKEEKKEDEDKLDKFKFKRRDSSKTF
jgi:hypothetical protein